MPKRRIKFWRKGKLKALHAVRVIDEIPTEVSASLRPEDVTNEENEAIEKLMTKLPEYIKNKKKRLKALLFRHQSIISKGEHDIGRTNLMENWIDTGEHRPIRQDLRRHPFRHLD